MKRRMFSLFIIFLFASQLGFGQNLISGNVIRANKKALADVKVTIEGVQGVEATTDMLGNFDIEVPLTAKILIFSYEGMKTQKIGIGKKSFISVTMVEGKDEIPPPVVKKEEKPKDSAKVKSKETPKKNETDNTKVKTNPQKDSKGNKPKEIITPDSTVKNNKAKESKPKEPKETKPKENNKEKEKTKTTKENKSASDSAIVKEAKTSKSAKPSKEETSKTKKPK